MRIKMIFNCTTRLKYLKVLLHCSMLQNVHTHPAVGRVAPRRPQKTALSEDCAVVAGEAASGAEAEDDRDTWLGG